MLLIKLNSSYRILKDTKIGNGVLTQGEVVTYTSGGYSPYDDCYIYQFTNAAGDKLIFTSQSELTSDELKNFEESNT